MTELVWVRAGDADEYNEFDSIAEAGEYLYAFKPCGPLERSIKYGLADDDCYTGQNYISLFWGDKDAAPLREISDDELVELNALLVRPR